MPKKSKITVTEKIKITREYVAGKIAREEAARRAEVAPSSIASWARIYRQEGALCLAPTKKNRVYSSQLKKKAVLEYLAGGCGLHAISEKYAIRSITQLRSWIKMYNTHGDFNSVKQSGGGSYMKSSQWLCSPLAREILYFFAVLLTGCSAFKVGCPFSMFTIYALQSQTKGL